MVRWCWVNFQCQGVLLIWIRVGQGPSALAVGAGGGCLDNNQPTNRFILLSSFFRDSKRPQKITYTLVKDGGMLWPSHNTTTNRNSRNSILQKQMFLIVAYFQRRAECQGS